MKEHPQLESLDGLAQLPALSELRLSGAAQLHDISDLVGAATASRLRTLQLQSCRAIERLDAVGSAGSLEYLNVSESGDIQSLCPLAALRELRVLYLYGTTRVLDGDLTPLTRMPRAEELRMQSRREYRPSVHEIKSHLADAHKA
jgi:hypothetical protein